MYRRRIKVLALFLSFIILFSSVPLFLVDPFFSSSRSKPSTDGVDENKLLYSFMVGDLTMSFLVLEPERHLLVIYESNGEESTFEVKVTLESEKYRTVTLVDGIIAVEATYSSNPLANLVINDPVSRYALCNFQEPPLIEPSYTYRWWDGIYQITGPSHLIKYHHPDREYYQISIWESTSLFGFEATHNQIDRDISRYLTPLGWAPLFAFIAGVISAVFGGYAGAFASALAAAFGYLFGYAVSALLGDEESCIWWWWGRDFDAWLRANFWWIFILPLDWFIIIVGNQLLTTGYYRVGSYTFCDGVGIGNP